jgi:hypothetical protein
VCNKKRKNNTENIAGGPQREIKTLQEVARDRYPEATNRKFFNCAPTT